MTEGTIQFKRDEYSPKFFIGDTVGFIEGGPSYFPGSGENKREANCGIVVSITFTKMKTFYDIVDVYYGNEFRRIPSEDVYASYKDAAMSTKSE